jgi:ankyrin repeat protein
MSSSSTTVSTTKLHELCNSVNPSIDMIRIYISTYPWSLKQKDASGNLPIHVALKRDDQAGLLICELLNKYPDGAKQRDSDGNLPLFLACRKQKVTASIIKALLQAYPAAAKVKAYGSLALHHLCQNGSATPDSIKVLIQANPVAVTSSNGFGNLPLHFICASDKAQVEATRILMNHYPAGITHLNKMNETPIARALKKNGSDEMKERVRLLLRLADKKNLNEEQLELLRELNWSARRTVILLCAHFAQGNDPNDRGLLHYYSACDGVFRHIINYL